jgi:hypothetical protein
MSDFPKGGDIPTTRAWLDSKGFEGKFVGWEADAILGLDESKMPKYVPEEENRDRLCGFLNTARQNSSGR